MAKKICNGIKNTMELIDSINTLPNGKKLLSDLYKVRGRKGVTSSDLQELYDILNKGK